MKIRHKTTLPYLCISVQYWLWEAALPKRQRPIFLHESNGFRLVKTFDRFLSIFAFSQKFFFKIYFGFNAKNRLVVIVSA